MRIGIDGRALTGRFTGDRTYWRNLLRLLPQSDTQIEYVVYSRTPISPEELPAARNLSCRVVPAMNDRLWTLATLPRALRSDRIDLLHVQYTTPPPGLRPCPVVTTVHDISFRLFPQWFPLRHRILLNLTVPASMRHAARVITDSESSRRDILKMYHLPGDKVVTIPLGAPDGFKPLDATMDPNAQESVRRKVKELYGVDAPFILAVGVLQPRKNLITLAEAYGMARSRHGVCAPLVIVGKTGWGTEQDSLRNAAALHGGGAAAQAIVFTGYVDDADLPLLYQACGCFAYPSLYEGFGLPPLEAMSCGAPTLVSDAPPMPEVAGDGAIVVPALDVEAWAKALAQALLNAEVRTDLRRRGPRRAAQFTWQITVDKTLEVYRQAVSGKSRHGE